MNEKIAEEIKKRAKIFVDDNLKNPTEYEYILIETAMMIGSSITIQIDMEETAENIENLEQVLG